MVDDKVARDIRKVALVLLLVIGMGHSSPIDTNKWSGPQIEAMVKLKELVERDEVKVEPWMTGNYTLAKWLQYHDFDVYATLAAIHKDGPNAKWRVEENIDKILEEDWSELRERFPYTTDTVDKEGRPIQYLDVAQWEVAKFLTYKPNAFERFLRYMVMWTEESEAMVRELRKGGKEVTQGTMIVNLASFTLLKHACISCLQVYHSANTLLGTHFPNARNKIILVGAPYLFKTVYFILTPTGQNQLVLYGQDRSQWEAALLESIDPDQLPQGLLENSQPLEIDNSEGLLNFKKEL